MASDIELEQLPRRSTCKLCELHKGADHVGIPTSVFPDPTAPSDTAVVLLGEKPGYHENQTGFFFTGRSGQLTRRGIVGKLILGKATAYLTNVVRCFELDPEQSQFKACFQAHFVYDLQHITAIHDRVAVVCMGSPAIRWFFRTFRNENVSIKDRHKSGTLVELPWGPTVTAITTFNPALVTNIDPNKIHAMADHLELLTQWLDDIYVPPSDPTIVPLTNPPKGPLT